MRINKTEIPGVLLITLDRHEDARGFFVERWSADRFSEHGLDIAFVQDNHSRSMPGVLRGIHYQLDPAQGKLVGVTRGAIYDVAVDLRPGSSHFGQHVGFELSDANGQLLWIPPGCGHGFCVMGGEAADVTYKCSAPYNAKGEGGIAYDDPDLAISWPVTQPLLSERDRTQESFAAFKERMQ